MPCAYVLEVLGYPYSSAIKVRASQGTTVVWISLEELTVFSPPFLDPILNVS
jgi:hypothetical protein